MKLSITTLHIKFVIAEFLIFIVMLSAIMLSVGMLNVVTPSDMLRHWRIINLFV